MKHELSSRGFKHMAFVTDSYGGRVKLYESSAADEPHIWIRVEQSHLLTPPDPDDALVDAAAHLTFDAARELRDQLDWLIDNHYQVKGAP